MCVVPSLLLQSLPRPRVHRKLPTWPFQGQIERSQIGNLWPLDATVHCWQYLKDQGEDTGDLRPLTVHCNRIPQHLKIDTIAKGGNKKNASWSGYPYFYQCCVLTLQRTVVVFICEYLLCNFLNAVKFENGNYSILWSQMTFLSGLFNLFVTIRMHTA